MYTLQHWLRRSEAQKIECYWNNVWFSAGWETEEAENIFLTHCWVSGYRFAGSFRSHMHVWFGLAWLPAVCEKVSLLESIRQLLARILKQLSMDQMNTVTVIIMHWTHYLFSDWPKAYSEFSKSAPMMSSSCRLDNNHIKDTRGLG